MSTYNNKIREFIQQSVSEKKVEGKPNPFWTSLKNTGTELWLDTGDMEEAELHWSAEMSALTTNNTLLNNEIQKGIYDDLISEASKLIIDIPEEKKVQEIAFILNALHGLRLVTRFGGYVSVELHTDTAHDIDAIVEYGKRFHEICPDKFVVKVPYTPAGFIGARKLKEEGVKINFTLEFSARQNVLVTKHARPDFLNVFLSRIDVYIHENNLVNGLNAGEMAVLSTQKWINKLEKENPWSTKLIVASLLSYEQLESLAGADIYTIPTKVAAEGIANLSGQFSSKINEFSPVTLSDSAFEAAIGKFWEVDNNVLIFGNQLALNPPISDSEFVERAHEAGCQDMFPVLTAEEEKTIKIDGRIPKHANWEEKIREGAIAPDTLLTLAGLAVFTASQEELDDRIKRIINK
ncbi:transaldolase family protein [Sunxiuqinia sp. A32]|uniref:transaldolase family protein n=1 Tax=Sunxiuqinia sp. A32 TaxID=3461496 RepID=UPI00404581AB